MKDYTTLPIQAKASLWFLVCSFLQKGISSITIPIFTRLLSTAEYGQFSVFNSWLGIVTIIVTLDLCNGVYEQGLIKFEKERNIFTSALQGLNISLVLIWTVIYILFQQLWNKMFSFTTVQMMAMLLLAWTTTVFKFWATEQRVRLHYRQLVCLTILVSLAKPVVGVILVVNSNDKVTARIIGLALVELIAYSGLFWVQVKRGKRFFDRRFWGYAIAFNLPLIPHYLSGTVLSSADRIMIKNIIGESEAGIYSVAYSISLLMQLFSTALNQTLGPWMYQKMKEKKAQSIAPIAYMTLILIAILNIMLIAFAPEIMRIFAPKSYYDAIWVIPPVSMSVYFMFSYSLFAKFEFYYEKTEFIAIASIVAAILNVVLNRICIPLFGYYAAGYTTLFCYIVYDVAHYIFMQKVCRIYMENKKVYDTKKLLIISILFLALGFSFLFLYRFSVLRFIMMLILVCGILLNYKKNWGDFESL